MWPLRELAPYVTEEAFLYTKYSYKLMKRLLPILLCFLAFAAPRLYGQKTYPVTFSATEGGTLTAQALNPWVNFQSGDQLAAGTNLNFTASANKGYQLE